MNKQINPHSFHIPVMGLGFTIDSPIKVAHYGISSVLALLDDTLLEKMREFYCKKLNRAFEPIESLEDDYRAKRITAYLDILDIIVNNNFADLIQKSYLPNSESDKYADMLPEGSLLKSEYYKVKASGNSELIIEWVANNFVKGSIDVNIMTRVDKENYKKAEKLPSEYNDAHAALRGFANSTVCSSVVLSSGLNPRLFSYFEKLKGFLPDSNGVLKKKVIIKVSDYRSAFVQGKILANKGIWVSEYRIESGLNCGGHAFATQGYLMGPILEEFKKNKESLISTLHELYSKALKDKNIPCPSEPYEMLITAQGGVGTHEEHEFLLKNYNLNSIGWGTPFLLVPEATNVDEVTLQLLSDATEDDLYLSDISPLGIPFNNLRGNTKDVEKYKIIAQGEPGSICTKRYSTLSKEFSEKGICMGSKQFQTEKVNQLKAQNLSEEKFNEEFTKITNKACICVGLGVSALIVNNIDIHPSEGEGVSVCPGPNMAYFSGVHTLKGMIDHIYGRKNIITRTDRPNMFIKELDMYISYLKDKVKEVDGQFAEKQKEYYQLFHKNLEEGIQYYKELFNEFVDNFNYTIFNELEMHHLRLQAIEIK
ncbi:MAG: hypothetical protein WCK02_00535 [Bacteroidota bacterium]